MRPRGRGGGAGLGAQPDVWRAMRGAAAPRGGEGSPPAPLGEGTPRLPTAKLRYEPLRRP